MTDIAIHPKVENGITASKIKDFAGGTLECKCPVQKVTIRINKQCSNTHLCGCSKCQKPEGYLFSLISTIPKENLQLINNSEKLSIVDKNATIQRHFCKNCGTHMFGRIEDKNHVFFGLDFIHTELSADKGWQVPTFSAFVSSLIESGTNPKDMPKIRQQLKTLGLPPYDCFSPELMDLIATFAYKHNK